MSRPTTRGMRRLRLLAAFLALSGVLAGCGRSGDRSATASTGQPIGLAQLTQAARSSVEATSGRFAFSLDVALPGGHESFAFSGEGAFDTGSDRASFSVDMSSFAALLGAAAAQ